MSFDWISKLAEGDSGTIIAAIAIMLVAAQLTTSMAAFLNSRRNSNAAEVQDAKWTATISVMADTISDVNRQHNERVTEIMTPLVQAVQTLGTLPAAIREMQSCSNQTAETLKMVADEMIEVRKKFGVVDAIQNQLGNVNKELETMTNKQDTLQEILGEKLDTIDGTLKEILKVQPEHIETTTIILKRLIAIQEAINILISHIKMTLEIPSQETIQVEDINLSDTPPTGG